MSSRAYFRESTIATWEDAKNFVRKLGPGWIFRGQCGSWDLKSSLERLEVADKAQAETILLMEFQRKARTYLEPHLVPGGQDILQWLSLMQHYGAPTRLQDWTHSPYVAFFFALERTPAESDRATVWALDLNWAQIAVQHILEQNGVSGATARHLTLGGQERLAAYFRKENPFLAVLPVEPWIYDARQTAQQSVFVCPGDIRVPFIDNVSAFSPLESARSVIRMALNPSVRQEALRDLRRMNVTAATLFPGLDGFGRSLQTRIFDPDYRSALSLELEGPAWLDAKKPPIGADH